LIKIAKTKAVMISPKNSRMKRHVGSPLGSSGGFLAEVSVFGSAVFTE